MDFLSAGVNFSIGNASILTQHRQEWNDAQAAANNIFTTIASGQIHVTITQVRRRVDTAYSKLQNAESYVETLENSLNVEERWSSASLEYQSFYQQTVQTNYEHALDELEHLVVMRLFELTKMSTSGTGMVVHLSTIGDLLNFSIGYKLCCQIGKALQHRSDAIKNALNRYNVQAAKLTPPRPSLSWRQIIDYSFLGEFDLLRHSRVDIRNQPWKVTRREATVKYFKLCRAEEELTRLNIEIRRL